MAFYRDRAERIRELLEKATIASPLTDAEASEEPTLFPAWDKMLGHEFTSEEVAKRPRIEYKGNDVAIIATGIMVDMAVEAAEMLKAEGISARVINIHTIKPIDREIIVKAAKETGAILTAEEHNVIGGLGSAVAEVVCEECPVPVVRLGVEDTFGRSGKVPALLELYGLTKENIVAKAKKALELKK